MINYLILKLFIFCTKEDKSADLIASNSQHFVPEIVYYEDLLVKDGLIWWKKDLLGINLSDRIIIRWPWVIGKNETFDYSIFVQMMIDKYSSQILLDQKCLSRYSPFYEDKLYQSFVFNDVGALSPKTWFFTKIEDLRESEIKFPVVVKQRISSRSKNNFKLDSIEEIERFLENKNIFYYIFQEYVEVKHDIRVLVLFDEILGAVERKTHIRENNRLAVKGMSEYKLNNSSFSLDIRKITEYMGADFVGFDILIDEGNSCYFIEANLSPLFDSFSEVTGINVGKKLLSRINF